LADGRRGISPISHLISSTSVAWIELVTMFQIGSLAGNERVLSGGHGLLAKPDWPSRK
jgi:hypothetical protein